MEEQVRSVLIERDLADLVDDQEAAAAQSGQFGSEFPESVVALQAGDSAVGGVEQDPVVGFSLL